VNGEGERVNINSELARIVHTPVLQDASNYQQRFDSAQPFRHVVIDDFFNDEFCANLCAQFPSFDEQGAINENGVVGGKSTQERVRELGSAYGQLDDIIQGQAFISLIEQITGIKGLKYDPHYFGGGTHENRQGQDLDAHVDFNYHPITRQHRRLNLIVYLNETWEDDWGGSLQLHRDPYKPPAEDDIITITPLMNRCVIFETNEYSWHGFERIQLPPDKQHLSRKSFALYFYSDTRPAKETAEEHSTVYVERHLPERYEPGMTLSESDLRELRLMLARRDQHLKRLYKNIHRLYGEVNRLKSLPWPETGCAETRTTEGVAATERMISMLRGRIHELENSTSWKLTAPVRAIKRLMSKQG